MRAEAVRVLHELNESTKAQQAFLNSCGDATWISDDERRAIRWLLSALIEHRRRVRITARMWRTLSPAESVGSELVSDTADLLDESRYFAPFIDAVALGGHRADSTRAEEILAQHDRARGTEPGRPRRRRTVRVSGLT